MTNTDDRNSSPGEFPLKQSETKSLLIGESANKEVVQGIREIVCSYKEIKQVNEVLTMHAGPDFILVNISVDFVDPILATDVEVTVAGLDRSNASKTVIMRVPHNEPGEVMLQ